uniref:Uncharacterized protein n=1 Tax=Anguilla anguilla TaxID=7936 RepID=A0A0E9VSR7_ANGAN
MVLITQHNLEQGHSIRCGSPHLPVNGTFRAGCNRLAQILADI